MSTSPADFNAQIIDEFHAKRAASATCSRVRPCCCITPERTPAGDDSFATDPSAGADRP